MRRFILLSVLLITASAIAQNAVLSSLKSPSITCDYLIICPDSFSGCAEALAAYRNNNASDDVENAHVATLSTIFNEFPEVATQPRCYPIWRMLKYACNNWRGKPEYVVLLGDDSAKVVGFDTSSPPPQSVGLMPTFIYEADTTRRTHPPQDTLIEYTDAIYYTVTDSTDSLPIRKKRNMYSMNSLSNYPFALGRIPAHTTVECSTYIEKVIRYETADRDVWYNNVLLMADDAYQGEKNDPVQPPHIESTERLATQCFRGFFIDKVYLSMYERSATQRHDNARNAFFSTVNQGARWIVYFGHGHRDSITDEGYLRAGDASLFSNGTAMPGFFSFSCSNGDFIRRNARQMCKTFLFAPNDGCIFYFAGSVETYAGSNERMAKNLFSFCKKPDYQSIGKTVIYAYMFDYSSFSAEAYHILGDPAVTFSRKKIPLETVVATKPDGSTLLETTLDQTSDLPVHYSYRISTGDSVTCLDNPKTRWWSEEVTRSFSESTTGSFEIEIPASEMKSNPRLSLYAWNSAGEYRFDTTFISPAASLPRIAHSTRKHPTFHLGQRMLDVRLPDTSPHTLVSLRLYSLDGKLILHSTVPSDGATKNATFKLAELPGGTYATVLTHGSSRISGKICISD